MGRLVCVYPFGNPEAMLSYVETYVSIGLSESPEAAKYHLHAVDVLPKIYSDEEGEDSFPRADKTDKDVSKQPENSVNISFGKKNSRQEIDTTEYHSNKERHDETDTENTSPKRVYSPLDQLPVDMTSEHLHPIDVNVIVSKDINRSHRTVLQDGDAENPDEENAFIYPRDSTDETSRRNFGTFSAGADEVNLY